MAEYKRKDMPEDMIVRISPGRNTITVQECSANGVVSYREINPIEFYFALNGSYTTNDYLDSGFLPEHCLHIAMNAAERRYVIWNPELRADVIYRDTEYRSFPLPRLIFGLRVLGNGKVADCSMGVVADETPTEDTPMFFYPFSNVYEDDRVCTGNNVLPRYKKLSALKNFPRYLLGLPDNDDMFDRRHNRKELEHKELMELLRDKDPAYYYQRCANRKQIETICVNYLRALEATKLSITGHMYFVPRTYMDQVDIFEDFILLLSGLNKKATPLVVNSFYIIDDAKQREKMTEEFYLAVKKEIAAYQEKCDYLIKSSSQSPAVMDRWVLKVRALEEKKLHYEGVLQRELCGLDDEFSVLKLLSQELQIRANSIRSQRFQQRAA